MLNTKLIEHDNTTPNPHTTLEIYHGTKLVATIDVLSNHLDYTDNINNIEYNLMEIEANGAVVNTHPYQI